MPSTISNLRFVPGKGFAYFCLYIYIKKCRPPMHQTKTEQNKEILLPSKQMISIKYHPTKKMTFGDAMSYGLSANFASNIKRVLINSLNFISPNTLINSLILLISRNKIWLQSHMCHLVQMCHLDKETTFGVLLHCNSMLILWTDNTMV